MRAATPLARWTRAVPTKLGELLEPKVPKLRPGSVLCFFFGAVGALVLLVLWCFRDKEDGDALTKRVDDVVAGVADLRKLRPTVVRAHKKPVQRGDRAACGRRCAWRAH